MTDSQKLDLLLEKVTSTDKKVAELKDDVEVVKDELAEVKREIEDLKGELAEVKREIEDLKMRVSNLEVGLKIVRLEMENEVKVNIQRVAEAHLDLSRKLDEARKPNEELEVLSIKVRNNESEIRKLNNRLDKCAPA